MGVDQPISLEVVKGKARRADAAAMKAKLFECCRAAIEQMGDNLAGFALVVWDTGGDMRTAYDTSHGPIGPALVPTLAADALNRHVAVMIAAQRFRDEG